MIKYLTNINANSWDETLMELRKVFQWEYDNYEKLTNDPTYHLSIPPSKKLNNMRRELGMKYKNLTSLDERKIIYEKNLIKYGDKYGPTIEYLRNHGKSWDEIIESSTRPGGQDLGF